MLHAATEWEILQLEFWLDKSFYTDNSGNGQIDVIIQQSSPVSLI